MVSKRSDRRWRSYGLSITLAVLFLAAWAGQVLAGFVRHNDEQREHGGPRVTLTTYLHSPEFVEATAENWESEFLQMALYVMLTAVLHQRGSAESKDPDQPAPQDREPDPKQPGAPWPVRKGGLVLALYKRSLSIAFALLFLISFAAHAAGGAAAFNRENAEHGDGRVLSVWEYLTTSQFWFESLQNWQSEFLAMLSIVLLSIWLRQQGSPESKPVDAPHSETGG